MAFMVSPEIRANPWSLYAKLRRKQPVKRIPPGIWLIATHADVAMLARDPRLGVDEGKSKWPPKARRRGPFNEAIGKSMLFLDPPDHERLRRLVARTFTPRRIEEMRGRVEELADAPHRRAGAAGPRRPARRARLSASHRRDLRDVGRARGRPPPVPAVGRHAGGPTRHLAVPHPGDRPRGRRRRRRARAPTSTACSATRPSGSPVG